jgi:hypothetical protein
VKRLFFLAFLTLAGLSAWWAWPPAIGDLTLENRRLVGRHGTAPFTPEKWLQASEGERGLMVADLLRKTRFAGAQNQEVFDLLGKSSCYNGYEDEPCHYVEYEGRRFRLAFNVNHSDRPGEILSVSVIE